MKRSEMKARLAQTIHDYQWSSTADEFADHLLNFLEQQGMLPPSAIFVIDWDRWDPEKKEWYPSKERIHSNKWEAEDETQRDD